MSENEAASAPTSAASALAGETTPEPAAAPAPAAEPAAEPSTPDSWFSGIEDPEVRGYAESKGWKNLESQLKSHMNLESMRGVPEAELARLPKEGDADGYRQLMQRLGTPEEATGYEFEGLEGEDLAWAQEAFYEANIPQDAAQKLLAKQTERIQAAQQAHEEAFVAQAKQEMEALRGEWGSAYEHNINAAQRAAQRLDIDGDTAVKLENAIGTTRFMKLFAEYGNATAEAGFVEGDSVHAKKSFGMTPEAARAAHKQYMNDPATRKAMLSQDQSIRDGAMQKAMDILRSAGLSS